MEPCSPGDLGASDAASIVDRRSAPRSANFCCGPLDGCCNADYTVLDSIDHAVTRPARALTVQHCPLPRCLQRIDRPTASRARWSRFAQAESFLGTRRRHFSAKVSMHLRASRRSSNAGEHVSGGDKCACSYTRRWKCDSGAWSPATPGNGCVAISYGFAVAVPTAEDGMWVHTLQHTLTPHNSRRQHIWLWKGEGADCT